MPHTSSRYEQEQGFGDGILICGIEDMTGFGTVTKTRNAAGDISYNMGSSLTGQFCINVGQVIQRTGLSDSFLQQFGGSGPSQDSGGQGIYGTDYTGNPETVRTTNFKKGLKLKGFKVYYQIGTLALTTHTCRVDKVSYADAAAPTITNILASAANGLTTATSVGKVVQVNLAAAEQIYRVNDMEELIIEISPVTPATSTYRIYRVELLLEFNFN